MDHYHPHRRRPLLYELVEALQRDTNRRDKQGMVDVFMKAINDDPVEYNQFALPTSHHGHA